jgi:hypothetical protein
MQRFDCGVHRGELLSMRVGIGRLMKTFCEVCLLEGGIREMMRGMKYFTSGEKKME